MDERFRDVFAQLRLAMLASAGAMPVARDEDGLLELRVPTPDPAEGEAEIFGMVKAGRSYVSCHLPPLYADPSPLDGISPALEKRRQGKTCFNFRAPDPALAAELEALVRRVAIRAVKAS